VDEAKSLARELASAKVPVVAVLGNHDYESDKSAEVKQTLMDSGVAVLDGDSVEIRGVGFAGVKGFAGGFGERALQSWGEPILKQFVREAVEEALKLEGALARLRTTHRIALLHYSPVRATVTDEPSEIAAFLGSSRLEDPLNRYPVTAAFHGHAHRGSPEGRTTSGVPVYNVALPLLRRRFPNDPPFRVIEVQVERGDGGPRPCGRGDGSHHPVNDRLPVATREFYLRAMRLLDEAGIEFLVGGAYAFERYTGIARHTKDFDIFVHPRDVQRVLETLGAAG